MPGKFNLNQLMNEHSKKEGGDDAFAFKIELLDIEHIEPSAMNFYTVDDVAELKASIELYGIQQNLVVRKQADSSRYELISGERRYTAAKALVDEGKDSFRRVPCKIIKPIDDIQAELQLILANSTSRRLTDYEITHQAQRLKALLSELKQDGYKFTGKKRDIVAELLNVSASQVARYESINKNLSPELTDEFKKENINITTAYELSRLPGEQQAEALADHQSGVSLTPDAVKARREKLKPDPAPQPDTASQESTASYEEYEAAKIEEYKRQDALKTSAMPPPKRDSLGEIANGAWQVKESDKQDSLDAPASQQIAADNATETAKALLPCPFCGSEAGTDIQPDGSYRIYCTDSFACGVGTKYTSPFQHYNAKSVWEKRI